MPIFRRPSAYTEEGNSGGAPTVDTTAADGARRPQSAADWERVIADLEQKVQANTAAVSVLEDELKARSLDAALGSAEAQARLRQLSKEISAAEGESAVVIAALQRARAKLAEAQRSEAQQAEASRRQQIARALEQCLEQARSVDNLMRELAAAFAEVHASLDSALVLMAPAERQSFNLLLGRWGGTLSAAHFGLDKFLELGAISAEYRHRQPLQSFLAPYTTAHGWLQPPPVSQSTPTQPPDTEQYLPESEALARARPKTAIN